MVRTRFAGKVDSGAQASAARLAINLFTPDQIIPAVCATIHSPDWPERVDLLEFRYLKLGGVNHISSWGGLGAIGIFREKLEQNSAAAWAGVASLCRKTFCRPDWALNACDESLIIDPRNPAAMAARIAANGALGDLGSAEADYLRIQAITPQYPHAQYAISAARLKNGRTDQAARPALAAYSAMPTKAGALLLANIAKGTGDPKSSERWRRIANEIGD